MHWYNTIQGHVDKPSKARSHGVQGHSAALCVTWSHHLPGSGAADMWGAAWLPEGGRGARQ